MCGDCPEGGAGCLYRTGGSLANTSLRTESRSQIFDLCSRHERKDQPISRYIAAEKSKLTHVPGFRPVSQIVMVDPSLQSHMLSHANCHVLSRRHVHHRGISRICIRNPQCDRKSVDGTTKGDGDCADHMKKERGEAILISWEINRSQHDSSQRCQSIVLTVNVRSGRKRRILGQSIGDILVRPIGIMVGLLGIVVVLQGGGVRRRLARECHTGCLFL